jgi:hypothetical protein
MPSGVRVSSSISSVSGGAPGGTSDGSPGGVSVSVSATLDYNGTPIPVSTGDLAQLKKGNFQFTLTQPVDLGQVFPNFLIWLHTEFGLPNLNDEVNEVISTLQSSTIGIIQQLGNLLYDIYHVDITITVFVINTATSTFKIAVTMTLANPFTLFNGMSLDSVGIQVDYN